MQSPANIFCPSKFLLYTHLLFIISPDYLQETIIHSINSLSLGNNGVPVCVLLDDLDVLLSLGWSLKTVVAMVSNVYNHLVSNGTVSKLATF